MQDKDFDQLFKDRFDGAEVQPSANLWGNIEQKLEPKKKRSFPVYWAAAAVAVVMITIGALTSKTETLKLSANPKTATIVSAVKLPSENKPAISSKTETVATYKSTPLVLTPRVKLENLVQKNNSIVMQSNETAKHQKIKPVTIIPSVKEETIQLIQEQTETMHAKVELPDPQNDIIAETESRPRRGIRNVGDVINFVVDKFDKREKKIIQFRTDEDDNSSLIAVNIGILKFNPKRNK